MSGGGGNQGAGASSTSGPPQYVQTWHSYFLGGPPTNRQGIQRGLAQTINELFDQAPHNAYKQKPIEDYFGNLSTVNMNVVQALSNFQALNASTVFRTSLSEVLDTGIIQVSVRNYTDMLEEQLDETIIPKFKAGMRNINATMSSSFVIGSALIHSSMIRQVGKYAADLQLKAFDLSNNLTNIRLQWAKDVIHYTLEGSRIYLVGAQEITRNNLETEIERLRWDFDIIREGMNGVAAIQGAVSSSTQSAGNRKPSALGGALSGAAAGASMGSAVGPWGTAVGAVVGGVAGYFGSS